MEAAPFARTVYRSTTNRQRVLTIVMVMFLYIIAAYLFFALRDRPPIRIERDTPIIVELLPQREPPQPELPAVQPRAAPKPAPATPRSSPVRVDTPPPVPVLAQAAMPRIDIKPDANASPVAQAPAIGIAESNGGGTGLHSSGSGSGADTGAGTGDGNSPANDRPTDLDSLTTPAWERDFVDINEVYPRSAKEARVAGRVRLVCQLTLGHHLVNCSVIRESPAGWRFGKAALEYSRQLRAYPVQRNGRAVDLAWVSFNIDFALPRQ